MPAVNVKVYRIGLTTEDVAAHFNCDQAAAERALTLAWEFACEQFWTYWIDFGPEQYWGNGAKVDIDPGGRSGGWLEVKGLPPVEEWNLGEFKTWDEFVTAVENDVKERKSKRYLLQEIENSGLIEDGN